MPTRLTVLLRLMAIKLKQAAVRGISNANKELVSFRTKADP